MGQFFGAIVLALAAWAGGPPTVVLTLAQIRADALANPSAYGLSSYQPVDATLTTLAAGDAGAAGLTLLAAATHATQRNSLGLGRVAVAILSASQTSNLTASAHVEFDTLVTTNGAGVALATGAGQADGIFTFASGRQYLIVYSAAGDVTLATNLLGLRLYNRTASAFPTISTTMTVLPLAAALAIGGGPVGISLVDATAGAVEAELRLSAVTGTITSLTAADTWLLILEL